MTTVKIQNAGGSECDDLTVSALLSTLLSNTTAERRTCTMSVNPYDTSWVSMIVKPNGPEKCSEWLFPDAFTFLVQDQARDGSWSSDISDLDAILSTMAALLALFKHQTSPHVIGCHTVPDITVRIARAVTWLESKLQTFDVDSCADNVGFEIILPSLLRLLRIHGVDFQASHRPDLFALADTKMAKFDKLIKTLYRGSQITALHSLEALIGRIDFDRLIGCKRRGGMLGSPSSTAAYLIYSSYWDLEAEQFLQDAFRHGEGKGTGGFASAHIIDYFEISWVLSTLLESNILLSDSNRASMDAIGDYLQSAFDRSKGILGFSRDMLPDADDTAKCIYTLQLLNRNPNPQPMIVHFQTATVFETYSNERTPSLSTNCNVLKALLVLPDADQYIDSIRIALDFICQSWFSGRVTDKWNVATEYTYMLLAQGLTTLVSRKDKHLSLSSYFDVKIPVILSQLVSRVLRAQASDGSWSDGKHEVTAYCILTLVSLATIPFPLGLNDNIASAIVLGRRYLGASQGQWRPEPIWIEKVRYSSKLLTNTYCICAIAAPLPPTTVPTPSTSRASTSMLNLFRRLPVFSAFTDSKLALECALVESQAFLLYLQSSRLDIFPRSKALGKEKYMEIIPFAWTACNALRTSPMPADMLMEMMTISLLNFQADEYFELITTNSNARNLRLLIDGVCGIEPESESEDKAVDTNGIASPYLGSNLPASPDRNGEAARPRPESLQSISDILTAYANRTLRHPAVILAPDAKKMQIRHALAAYLRAQVDSAMNRFLTPQLHTNGKTLFDWVRTLGADDTSCPYSFAFYIALSTFVLGIKDTSENTLREYLMKALCGSLATMCRMYNDYGSQSRDRDEGNLNCIDFFGDAVNDTVREERQPNKHQACVGNTDRNKKDRKARLELMRLADFERSCMELALSGLKDSGLKGPMLEALLLFIDVTDLFGQIYVEQDIGTKTK